jgi:hypothetical protein
LENRILEGFPEAPTEELYHFGLGEQVHRDNFVHIKQLCDSPDDSL